MSGLNAFAIDVAKEEAGIWESVGDMEFLVARAGNTEWKKLYKRLEAITFGPAYRKKEKDPEKELAYDILSDKRFKLLTEELLDLALNQERFKEDMMVEDEKK